MLATGLVRGIGLGLVIIRFDEGTGGMETFPLFFLLIKLGYIINVPSNEILVFTSHCLANFCGN